MTTATIREAIRALKTLIARLQVEADAAGDTVLQELIAALIAHLSAYDHQRESYGK